ncbi:putative ABC transporter transmembrane protein [Alloactinosynnema sp. L-07]|uniref:ABC transporter transmembrane domain-containing protein n=1 Tax=Alloactinosynnema sp. L-07 TaxID=1653480 RepID=UPI00065F02C3|nr:ABC transporter ATP-binding protein [Alloactinosynnema sp. L-07]CRK57213.1 putative ABC transporter transmembrane protein [Alloactinosynnema sp. L-07]
MNKRVPHADPGTPDARGPWHYLWWLVISQRGRVAFGALWGTLWMLGLMVPPYLVARAIDDGLRARDVGALVFWAVAILVSGLVNAGLGALRHGTMTRVRTDAAYRTVQVIARRSVELGAALPRRVSTGELTTIHASDLFRIAQALTMAGPGVGAIIAYTATAVLLFTISTLLATVVVVGVPVLCVVIGPLLARLRRVEAEYRTRQGELTARAADIVAGLRVLCGIGGKATFAANYRRGSRALLKEGYRVGGVASWAQAAGAFLPMLFLAAVVWISARMAAAGTITIGEMVAVYGYVAVLVVPVSFLIDDTDAVARALVSAERVLGILTLTPDVEDATGKPGPAGPAPLRDPASGLVVAPGRLIAVATDDPAAAIAVVDRLGRYAESDVTWGEVPLAAVALAEVRRRVMVSDNDAYLFAGPLRAVIGAPADDSATDAALRVANAHDIVDALADGLDSEVQAQGRDLSGGQRQRIRLVRALLADPEVLLLVEPTSAVDSNTEAVIAHRLRAARAGRATVLVSTSPLVLDVADEVAYLVGGRVAAMGRHTDLLAEHPGYRDLVFRGEEVSAR